MSRTFDVRWRGTHRRVEMRSDGTLVVDGEVATVEPAGPDAWRVSIGGRTSTVLAAGAPGHPWLFHRGTVVRPEIDDPVASSGVRHTAASAIAAPMPASVRAVLVAPGDPVTEGQTLIVLEAMKMELPLRAPADGTVAAVHCAVGDLVQPGTELVELA
ncbi:MAG TPA: biotin/lipoyl-containing protein [Vicinamibacterales bacterium]